MTSSESSVLRAVLGGRCHGVGSVHATTCPRPGTRIPHNVCSVLAAPNETKPLNLKYPQTLTKWHESSSEMVPAMNLPYASPAGVNHHNAHACMCTIYIHTYVHTYMYMHIHIYVDIHIQIHVHIRVQKRYMHGHVHVHMHINLDLGLDLDIYIDIYIYITHIHIYIYICTYTYIYIYIHLCRLVDLVSSVSVCVCAPPRICACI